MSLASALPAPINVSWDNFDDEQAIRGLPAIGALVSAKVSAPPYGKRKGWVPRNDADFGDGGAFPEIQVAQYPLGMLIKNYFCSLFHIFIVFIFILIRSNIKIWAHEVISAKNQMH